MPTGTRDYQAWHAGYDDPGSALSWRLRTVQAWVSRALDEHAGQVQVLSLCAGDGRDVIEVLAARPDRERVRATLLELHPGIADRARSAVAAAGLGEQVEVRSVDAGKSDAFAGLAPADVVLLVGVLGNIGEEDLPTTIAACPQLCTPGATLIWSRGRGAEVGDRDTEVRAWFTAAGFEELDHAALEDGSRPALGAVRYDGPPRPVVPGRRWFTFRR